MDAETSVRDQNEEDWADIFTLCPELIGARLQPTVNDFTNHRQRQPRD